MVAMLAMTAVVPFTSAIAGQRSGTVAAKHEMPCHKLIKSTQSCPGCPEKACADGAACMVKCFQQLSAVLAKEWAFAIPVITVGVAVPDTGAPRTSRAPPLRPPIV